MGGRLHNHMGYPGFFHTRKNFVKLGRVGSGKRSGINGAPVFYRVCADKSGIKSVAFKNGFKHISRSGFSVCTGHGKNFKSVCGTSVIPLSCDAERVPCIFANYLRNVCFNASLRDHRRGSLFTSLSGIIVAVVFYAFKAEKQTSFLNARRIENYIFYFRIAVIFTFVKQL